MSRVKGKIILMQNESKFWISGINNLNDPLCFSLEKLNALNKFIIIEEVPSDACITSGNNEDKSTVRFENLAIW